jgi:hypothetical protein
MPALWIADDRPAGTNLMTYVALTAVAGILLLQWTGAIPLDSVGGAMVVASAILLGTLAVAIHEAWTRKRSVLGWIVNVIVALVGAFLVAPFGGMVMVMLLSPFINGSSSLAAAGDPQMSIALAGQMAIILMGSSGALWLMNRWR